YSLDLDYQHNHGVRPNNELSRIEWYSTIKQQLTERDSLLAIVKYQDNHSGDNFQYYDPAAVRTDLQQFGTTNAPLVRTNFSLEEPEMPIVAAGYHREWSPGVHTLFLGAYLSAQQQVRDSKVPELRLENNDVGQLA